MKGVNLFYSKLMHDVRAVNTKMNFARTTNIKSTYFNRIVEMWSSIPLDIRLSPSLAVFKSRVRKFLSKEH